MSSGTTSQTSGSLLRRIFEWAGHEVSDAGMVPLRCGRLGVSKIRVKVVLGSAARRTSRAAEHDCLVVVVTAKTQLVRGLRRFQCPQRGGDRGGHGKSPPSRPDQRPPARTPPPAPRTAAPSGPASRAPATPHATSGQAGLARHRRAPTRRRHVQYATCKNYTDLKREFQAHHTSRPVGCNGPRFQRRCRCQAQPGGGPPRRDDQGDRRCGPAARSRVGLRPESQDQPARLRTPRLH
jgi:hypothetical protein